MKNFVGKGRVRVLCGSGLGSTVWGRRSLHGFKEVKHDIQGRTHSVLRNASVSTVSRVLPA